MPSFFHVDGTRSREDSRLIGVKWIVGSRVKTRSQKAAICPLLRSGQHAQPCSEKPGRLLEDRGTPQGRPREGFLNLDYGGRRPPQPF